MCALSTAQLFDGEVHAAVVTARDAVARGRGFRGLAPARELYLGLALANADQLDEAEIWLRTGERVADEVSDLWLVSRHQLARMSVLLNTGDWDRTVADAESVISLHADTGMGTGMPQAPATAGIVAVRRGASDGEVARLLELSTRHATAGAEPSGLLYVGWLQALVAQREGRHEEAAATLGFVIDAVVALAPLVQMWMAADLVAMRLAAGDRAGARATADQMARFSEVVGCGSARGVAALCAGLVAAADGSSAAPGLLRDAATLLRTARWRPSLLVALDAVHPLLAGRAADEAARERTRLRSELGMRADDRGVAATAAPAVSSAVSSVQLASLTPTERQVAGLVGEGLTNAAIAVRLGMSKRTVEYHVSNLYVKLGVANRVALADVASATR